MTEPTRPHAAPEPGDDTEVDVNLKELLQTVATAAAEAAAKSQKDLIREVLKEIKASPAKGSDDEKKELEQLRQRFDALAERLRERIFDADNGDLEKARTVVSRIEDLFREELKIKLPAKRPAKKAPATEDKSKTKATEAKEEGKSALKKFRDSATLKLKDLFTDEDAEGENKGHH